MVPFSEIGFDFIICWICFWAGIGIGMKRPNLFTSIPALLWFTVHHYSALYGTHSKFRYVWSVADNIVDVFMVLGIIAWWFVPLMTKKRNSRKTGPAAN